MTWRGYMLVLAVISLIAGGWWTIDRALTPPVPFPSDVLSVVRHADRVRVQKMQPLVGNPPQGAAFYENCSMVGVGKAIDPPDGWLDDFRNLVTDGRTYDASTTTGTPMPKMVVRFAKADTKVDVMVSFDYDTIVVQEDGKPRGTGVCVSRRADLVRLAKKLFPDDREIQLLQ